ncbi:helix-turn-helix domain-containing protein [Microbacterium sp. SL75]|uniref:helix-turn-helix domain-containing protein n=1 Tax=Microbacterium sp. SL75 TaxID=2995140 RepID=UPI00226E0ABF|nr:helix-turn-helix transcriptional regulator [Microbacterium sp. SL75]WAC68867.1 helix-turn-helix transcriptional regulator [Microbacterium sp. SL75]
MDQYVAAASAELRAAQGRANLNDVALAAKSGIPVATLRRYLKGDRDTPVSALFRIAKALGVDAGRLLDDAAERVQDA